MRQGGKYEGEQREGDERRREMLPGFPLWLTCREIIALTGVENPEGAFGEENTVVGV